MGRMVEQSLAAGSMLGGRMRIGRLVKHKKYKWIGLVLDWRHTGRFYPGIELTIRKNNQTLHADERSVEYLDETG